MKVGSSERKIQEVRTQEGDGSGSGINKRLINKNYSYS